LSRRDGIPTHFSFYGKGDIFHKKFLGEKSTLKSEKKTGTGIEIGVSVYVIFSLKLLLPGKVK
jgi:hypothetical protein